MYRFLPITILTFLSILIFTGSYILNGDHELKPGEGLFKPGQIETPFDLEHTLDAVSRVKPLIQQKIILFEHDDQLHEARRQPGARDKIFRETGGVHWPVLLTETITEQLCGNPIGQNQPGFFEICNRLENHRADAYPDTLLTDFMEGTASGFFLDFPEAHPDSLYLFTNYHVVRESLERHGVQNQSQVNAAVPSSDTRVLISADGSHSSGSYQTIDEAEIFAHASEEEWQHGLDWAVIRIAKNHLPDHIQPLKAAADEPVPGDSLWAAGFPTRTVRGLTEESPYSEADDELRISRGTLVHSNEAYSDNIHPTDLVAQLDAVSGNSGSVILNDHGHVTGILRHTTHRDGEFDLRIADYGGYALLVPIREVLKQLQ